MNQEEQKKISQLIAKCWADEGFKKKVLADPAKTLRAERMEFRDDLSYVAHENTDKVFHLVIPAKPTELSDEDLAHVAGGTCQAALGRMAEAVSLTPSSCYYGPTCCGW
jgi:hypothetical protein